MRTIRNKVDEMILQTRASIVCDLLASESEETSHLKAVRDALILAKINNMSCTPLLTATALLLALAPSAYSQDTTGTDEDVIIVTGKHLYTDQLHTRRYKLSRRRSPRRRCVSGCAFNGRLLRRRRS